MWKIKWTLQMLMAFAGGLASGLLLACGADTWAQRDGLPGGEALILPLIILLVCLGWQMGAMWHGR